jgi:hypothetical protein
MVYISPPGTVVNGRKIKQKVETKTICEETGPISAIEKKQGSM